MNCKVSNYPSLYTETKGNTNFLNKMGKRSFVLNHEDDQKYSKKIPRPWNLLPCSPGAVPIDSGITGESPFRHVSAAILQPSAHSGINNDTNDDNSGGYSSIEEPAFRSLAADSYSVAIGDNQDCSHKAADGEYLLEPATPEDTDEEHVVELAVLEDDKQSPAVASSKMEIGMVELIQLCNQAGTPISFLDKLMRLLKDQTQRGFEIAKAPSRDNFMKQLRTKYPYAMAEPINTPSGKDFVFKFNFMDQLHDLLSSDFFMSVDSCCVNTGNEDQLFAQYEPQRQEGLSEVLSAEWYRLTYEKRIGVQPIYIDPETNLDYHNWLIPVIFYNDKTGVSAMEGSYTLEPFVFTLGIVSKLMHGVTWDSYPVVAMNHLRIMNPSLGIVQKNTLPLYTSA